MLQVSVPEASELFASHHIGDDSNDDFSALLLAEVITLGDPLICW